MKWLNYHHLLYFRTIATEGSLARASQKLNVGQPALSAQLKRLEESLGEQLFERRNRKLILTEQGELALRYANRINDMGEEFIESLQNKMFSEQASIQIGALDSVPKQILLKLVQAARRFGAGKVSIFEGSGDELFRLLDTHHLDIVITNYRRSVQSQRGFKARSLGKLPVGVYGTKAFLPLKKNFPTSLNEQPFILSTHHSQLRHDFNHFLQTNNIQIRVVAESQDTSLKKLLGADGIGLFPLAEVVMKPLLINEERLEHIGRLKNVFDEYWLIEGERLMENPVAKKLMDRFRI